MTFPKSSADPVGAAMRELLLAAKILQQNSEGCASNHYGHDCELNGLPGWLADTKKAIMKAEAALSTPPVQAITEAMVEAYIEQIDECWEGCNDRPDDWKRIEVRYGLEAAFRLRPSPSDDAQREVRRDDYLDRFDEFKEALSDLCHLHSEEWALTGGGPGIKERWEKAWTAALELVRIES